MNRRQIPTTCQVCTFSDANSQFHDDNGAIDEIMMMMMMMTMMMTLCVEWWLTDDGFAPMADSFRSANFVKTEIFHNARPGYCVINGSQHNRHCIQLSDPWQWVSTVFLLHISAIQSLLWFSGWFWNSKSPWKSLTCKCFHPVSKFLPSFLFKNHKEWWLVGNWAQWVGMIHVADALVRFPH